MNKIDYTHIACLDVIDAVLCPKLDKIVSLATCMEGMNFHKCPYYVGKREKGGRKEILCSYPFVKINGKWRKNED